MEKSDAPIAVPNSSYDALDLDAVPADQVLYGEPERDGWAAEAAGTARDAMEYLRAAEALAATDGFAVAFLRPTYFLIGQALELSLKSLCGQYGVKIEDVKARANRHDLAALLIEAEKIWPLAPEFVSVVRAMARHHTYHQFRYDKKTPFVVYPAPTVFGMIRPQMERIADHASSLHSLEVRKRWEQQGSPK